MRRRTYFEAALCVVDVADADGFEEEVEASHETVPNERALAPEKDAVRIRGHRACKVDERTLTTASV